MSKCFTDNCNSKLTRVKDHFSKQLLKYTLFQC